MDRKDKQALQELLSHHGWELFKELVLVDKKGGFKDRKSLRSQVQDKLNAEARAGNWEKVSYYTGQLDLMELIVNLPQKELERAR
jgi:hypothetical protein